MADLRRKSDLATTIQCWLTEPLSPDVRRSVESITRVEGVERIAVMPDVHLAHHVCVGLVVATQSRVLPQAVGGDIGCGMLAAPVDATADLLSRDRRAYELLAGLALAVPAARHRSLALCPPLPEDLSAEPLSRSALSGIAARAGRVELGTLGGGNHFVEFQSDEEDRLWLLIHSGSRCMGQAIRDAHTPASDASPRTLVCLEADSPAGAAYLRDHDWARRYADANRRRIAAAIDALLGRLFAVRLAAEDWISCDHNHVSREMHFGRELWVHRKGAAPAFLDQPGVVPGSMGSCSFHTRGRGCEAALCSSSHGAGRRMSRSDARRRISARRLQTELDAAGVHHDRRVARRLCEEAPGAYKDVAAVMRAQRELTRITRRLRPLLVYKGV